jgi:hypothetical protein
MSAKQLYDFLFFLICPPVLRQNWQDLRYSNLFDWFAAGEF